MKAIEQVDSVLTSKQQIDRLHRPGSTYFNLNPFEVKYLKYSAEWKYLSMWKKTMNADNGEKNQCCVSLKRKKIGLSYTSFRQ